MTAGALACRTARRRTVPVGALALAALEWGAPGAPILLFLHGGAAHAHWFDRVAAAFSDRFHVLALDQRGHGESSWAVPPAYATEDFAADLAGVLDALGAARATLVGHSMGGHNALAFAAWHPERLDALVVVDSRPAIPPERLGQMRERGRRPPRRHPSLAAAVAAFRLLPPDTSADRALLAHLARQSYVERHTDGGPGWTPRFDPACYATRRPVDGWPLLPRVEAPTLVVRGELSPVLPRDMAERLCALVPRATLVEIPGAHHHLVLDRPEAFVQALGAFLAFPRAAAG